MEILNGLNATKVHAKKSIKSAFYPVYTGGMCTDKQCSMSVFLSQYQASTRSQKGVNAESVPENLTDHILTCH